MSDIRKIEYIRNPKRPTGWEEDRVCLGAYKVVFDDGYRVIWAHMGLPGTISAVPLDPENEGERAVLADTAKRLRASTRRLHDTG